MKHFAALGDLTILDFLAVLEERGKEEERLKVFDDFTVTSDPSLTESAEESEALPAFGRWEKRRYALDEVVEAVAVAMVARRRDAMRKFMVVRRLLIRNYELMESTARQSVRLEQVLVFIPTRQARG